jgi:hypothetical protein
VTADAQAIRCVIRGLFIGTPDEVRDQLHRCDGLADWVLLTPASGLGAGELEVATRTIIRTFS